MIVFTVNPSAINSSGTNSGRNIAGVIQGHFVLTGNKVTITSPFAKIDIKSNENFALKM